MFQKYHDERSRKADLVCLFTHRRIRNTSTNFNTITSCLRLLFRFLKAYRERGFRLYKMDQIEELLIICACKKNLLLWYIFVYHELENTKDISIVGADEINLEGSGKNPYYITDPTHRIIMQNDPRFNHPTIIFSIKNFLWKVKLFLQLLY